jgi:hypothetical protein
MRQRPIERIVVACIGVAAGVGAALADLSPTGSAFTDLVSVVAIVSMVTIVASNAPLSTTSWSALAAGAASASIPLAIAGLVTFVVGARARDRFGPAVAQAGSAAIALNIAARSELEGFFGLSALVAIAIAGWLTWAGLAHAPARVRRLAIVTVTALLSVTVVGLVAGGFASARSVDKLERAAESTDSGIAQLRAGRIGGASASFLDASRQFSTIASDLSSPLVALTAGVPVVAQHRRAALDVATQAAVVSEEIAHALDEIDYEALTGGRPGRIDVAAIAELQGPLARVTQNLVDLDTTIDRVRSPWLAGIAADGLDDLSRDVNKQLRSVATISDIAYTVPAMLGADETRTYLVAFTTPAEARGLGGFMGNWALLSADGGQITMTDFGRRDRLERGASAGSRTLSGPAEWLARYGQFGYTSGPRGTVGAVPWANHTMSPQADSTGMVAAQLFPQSGGEHIDGYFAIDVFALSRLLEFTGPVPTTDGRVVNRRNAAEFLLNGQYGDARSERVDLLEEVSRSVADSLLGKRLPPLFDLFDALGPMVDDGRLVGWAAEAAEQAMFERTGIAGGLPDPGTGDGVAVTFNNAVGNKIDYFLRSRVDYDVTIDPSSAAGRATTEIRIENTAPATGQPVYVVGNKIGLPTGTNRTYVSAYSVLPIDQVTLDGEEVDFEVGTEAGYFVAALYVDTVPGTPRSIKVSQSGTIDLTDGYQLALSSPPTVRATPVTATISIRGKRESVVTVESGSTVIGLPVGTD